MLVPKIKTNKFDGKSDFVMWPRKMKAVLLQNKIAPSICSPEEYPKSWKDLDLQKENNGENLFVRGRVDRREPPSHRFKSKGESLRERREGEESETPVTLSLPRPLGLRVPDLILLLSPRRASATVIGCLPAELTRGGGKKDTIFMKISRAKLVSRSTASTSQKLLGRQFEQICAESGTEFFACRKS
ncbi:hypothetical protein M9H77_31532 [Catharanthus roseus]|uniref:Uncharacterized protein n=1 Tax=Catharanthus roseus TaxID=4058 RepID=A0ACC0A1D1_CATRO|nr:hypothetical protein M9H77_31532 [Catharanthus roseus]